METMKEYLDDNVLDKYVHGKYDNLSWDEWSEEIVKLFEEIPASTNAPMSEGEIEEWAESLSIWKDNTGHYGFRYFVNGAKAILSHLNETEPKALPTVNQQAIRDIMFDMISTEEDVPIYGFIRAAKAIAALYSQDRKSVV